MRRQHERFSRSQGSPFECTREHPCPRDAGGQTGMVGTLMQFLPPIQLVWPSNYEMPLRLSGQHHGKSIDQQVAAFLRMEAPHVQDESLASQLWKALEKGAHVGLWITLRCRSSKA